MYDNGRTFLICVLHSNSDVDNAWSNTSTSDDGQPKFTVINHSLTTSKYNFTYSNGSSNITLQDQELLPVTNLPGDGNTKPTMKWYKLRMNNTGFVPTTKAELQTAVDAWVANSTTATTTYGDINDWNVSSITDMSNLFQAKTTFNSDISNWDVSAVTDMRSMFEGATAFNQDISGWVVSSVTNMSSMFKHATIFNQPLTNWTRDASVDISASSLSNVTDMSSMFEGALAFNQSISNWDIYYVEDVSRMFSTDKIMAITESYKPKFNS